MLSKTLRQEIKFVEISMEEARARLKQKGFNDSKVGKVNRAFYAFRLMAFCPPLNPLTAWKWFLQALTLQGDLCDIYGVESQTNCNVLCRHLWSTIGTCLGAKRRSKDPFLE